MTDTTEDDGIAYKRHAKYFKLCLTMIPERYASLETSRMTIAFFCISGLDLLGSLDTMYTAEDKAKLIDWIYSQQVVRESEQDFGSMERRGGFRGSPFVGNPFNCSCAKQQSVAPHSDCGHIAMTYTALCLLLILGDDLSRVDRQYVISSLKDLQLPNGSFQCTPDPSESDMRFLYCAAAVSYMLNDFSGMDCDRAVSYIQQSMGYDYGIAQGPGEESHGGSTFCAVAALKLMGRFDSAFDKAQVAGLTRWCLMRQQSGFQGRPNKPTDTCYSFWVGATLKLLDSFDQVHFELNRAFLLDTQHDQSGGFSKWKDHHTDPLHSYFGLCGFSLMAMGRLRALHPALNITQSAADRLSFLH